MPGKIIKNYLDENGIKYVVINHSPAYTAQEIAESAHVSGKEMLKTIIINVDNNVVMSVMPANRRLIIELLKDKLNANKIELASENEFKNLFPDCEIGAMPPFGNIYQMDVITCDYIEKSGQIAFNAGSHSEIIKMDYRDYVRLVNPKVLNFTT
jgi:Ala-tRNA(Pro) deacylase